MGPTPSDPRAARDALLARRDLTGEALRRELTGTVDRWLAGVFTAAAGDDRAGLALVAVGGYGRAEPAPFSDLDLVLLHAGRSDVAEVADRLWYPVWDSGFGLDHSVRTVAEAVVVSRSDLKAALGLLDARHVTGDPELTRALVTGTRESWRRDAPRRLPELADSVDRRAESAGELAFLLEPDVKDARGGLRDVQAMAAVAAAWVADAPGGPVRAAGRLLLDVRGELHRATGRGTDRLLLQEQDAVAAAIGSADADELMTRVYAAGRAVAYAGDRYWRRAREQGGAPRRWGRRRREAEQQRRPLANGVVEQGGVVVLALAARPAADPALVLRAAAAAAQHGLRLSPHALERLAAESAPPPRPWPAEARDALVSLLGAGRAAVPVLEDLDQVGLLARLLPEWQRVRCRPQRNAVHRFTVDRHLVEAAVEAGALARRVSRPDLLLLGAFLHDIGKGWPGDHTEQGVRVAEQLGPRLGLVAADTEVLVTLVRHHLLLPDTATRRDLDDPATVRLVADAVRDRDTLDLLHALTEADALATGPAAWSDWKAGLVADLVRRTAAVLSGAPPPSADVLTERARALAAGGELAVDVDGDLLTVVAPDRPGLLWRWAGVLALHRLDVRGATATSVGPMAVTVFDVTPRFGSPPDWAVVRDDLRHAFAGTLPLGQRLADRERAYRRDPVLAVPPTVRFEDASELATVVEVRAHDSVGLLYRLARVLDEHDLDVRRARVSTLGAEAVDSFYVLGADGSRVTDEGLRATVAEALLTAAAAPA